MSRLRTPVTENDHKTGNPNAGITLVEYGDFECSHCGTAHPLVKRLLEEYGEELCFVFRHFPLQQMHPMAMMAAVAAEAAGKQGKFWEMHDLIYEDQENLNGDNLLGYAKILGLNLQQFADDWKDEVLATHVEQDMESGIRSGVNGTPSFFLNGTKVDSYDESYESLAEAVQSMAS
jgi:protein-disulfide isomerase